MKFQKDTWWNVGKLCFIHIIEDPVPSDTYEGKLMSKYKLYSNGPIPGYLRDGKSVHEESYWHDRAKPATKIERLLFT